VLPLPPVLDGPGAAPLAPLVAGAPVVYDAPPVMGPGGADADAAGPTREPSPCPEGPWKLAAFCWNAANVLLPLVGALIAPTMPAAQCGAGTSCLQKNHKGLVELVIVKFHSGVTETLFVGMKTQPESNPPGTGLQGSANVDWVILWFPGAPVKRKVIVVPLVALMELGMNWKIPPGASAVEPTRTTWLLESF